MKKDFDRPLADLDGAPLADGGAPVTVKGVCVNALLAHDPQDNPPGEEKLRRYQLAARLHRGGEQDVTAEEVALVKRLAGRLYLPLVVGQLYEHLEA